MSDAPATHWVRTQTDLLRSDDSDEPPSTEMLNRLEREACQTMATRATPGAVVLAVLVILIGVVTDLAADATYWWAALVVVSCALAAGRIPHLRSASSLTDGACTPWRTRYGAGALVHNAVFCVTSCLTVYRYGITWSGFFALLASAATVTVAATVYAPWRQLARAIVAMFIVLHMVVAFNAGPGGIALTVAFGVFGIYLYGMAGSQNREYWRSVLANLLLEARAQELERARDAAKLASRAKDDFLATMSHEVRTPLNAIMGMAQMLRTRNPDPDTAESAIVILEASESLKTIVDDVLDFARIQRGRMTLDEHPFDLAHVARATAALFRAAANQKGIGIDVTFSPDAELTVSGDSRRYRQVLTNLVNNAIKFTKGGSVRVEVSCSEVSEEELLVATCVSDTGIGIPKEHQGRVFHAFSQVDSSSTREHGGTGLGLSIAKELTEMMGGTIKVDSDGKSGTAITFTMVARHAPGPSSSQRAEASSLAGLRVLLVEDNPINQTVAIKMLEQLDCVVTLAQNGEEGVSVHKEGSFDVVLMDCEMPVLDGFAATRAIRNGEHHPDVPIVAMTAYTLGHQKEQCLDAGMDGHIGKPVDLSGLARALRKHALDKESAVDSP